MGNRKIPIIICIIIIISLTGYVILNIDKTKGKKPANHDRGTASASTVSSGAVTFDPADNSGNYTYIPPTLEYDDSNKDKEVDQMSDKEPTKAPWTPATEMDLDPTSITVYVNKEYGLPKDYVPKNLVVPNITFDTSGYSERKLMRKEAAEAIEKLFAAALKDGYTLYGISGYRSYNRQKEIFLNNIVQKGKNHTLKYSAAPGTSEHQTGLAMDVSSKSVRYRLITAFAYSDEGKWLAEHAHEYGFIIRYPKDRSLTTGYAYEPWHIRYVGEDLANYLYTNNLTLDEYYNYVPSEGFDYEKKYADLINYVPPATPTPIPEEELEELDPLDEDLEEENLDGEELEDEDLEDDELEDKGLEDEELEDEELSDHSPKDEEKKDNEFLDDQGGDLELNDWPLDDLDNQQGLPKDNDNSIDQNKDTPPSTPTSIPTSTPTGTPTSIPTSTPTNTPSNSPTDIDTNSIN